MLLFKCYFMVNKTKCDCNISAIAKTFYSTEVVESVDEQAAIYIVRHKYSLLGDVTVYLVKEIGEPLFPLQKTVSKIAS